MESETRRLQCMAHDCDHPDIMKHILPCDKKGPASRRQTFNNVPEPRARGWQAQAHLKTGTGPRERVRGDRIQGHGRVAFNSRSTEIVNPQARPPKLHRKRHALNCEASGQRKFGGNESTQETIRRRYITCARLTREKTKMMWSVAPYGQQKHGLCTS